MVLTVIKVFYKKLETKTITYRTFKPFSNEAFMVDIQKRTFWLIFLKQLLVKLFNEAIFSTIKNLK